jgi:hypothetical protein
MMLYGNMIARFVRILFKRSNHTRPSGYPWYNEAQRDYVFLSRAVAFDVLPLPKPGRADHVVLIGLVLGTIAKRLRLWLSADTMRKIGGQSG